MRAHKNCATCMKAIPGSLTGKNTFPVFLLAFWWGLDLGSPYVFKFSKVYSEFLF